MVELKDLLAQWKDLPQLMGMEDTLAPRLDKEGNRELNCSVPILDAEGTSGASEDAKKLGGRSTNSVQATVGDALVDSRGLAEVSTTCTGSPFGLRDTRVHRAKCRHVQGEAKRFDVLAE